MVYSDTSGLAGIIQEEEFLTGLGDAGISGNTSLLKHFTRLNNARYYQIVSMILASQDEWQFDDSNLSNYPTATRPLVATRRDYYFGTALWALIGREGGAAASVAAIKPLKIMRVDITYDGTNYYKAEPFDQNETGLGLGNDNLTDGRFAKNAPYYDIRDNSLWLYPMASASDVTNGGLIRITFSRELDEFTTADTTQEPGFDETFHKMLPVGASLDFAVAKGLANKNDLAAIYQDYEVRLKQYYGSKQEDRNYVLKPAYINYE